MVLIYFHVLFRNYFLLKNLLTLFLVVYFTINNILAYNGKCGVIMKSHTKTGTGTGTGNDHSEHGNSKHGYPKNDHSKQGNSNNGHSNNNQFTIDYSKYEKNTKIDYSKYENSNYGHSKSGHSNYGYRSNNKVTHKSHQSSSSVKSYSVNFRIIGGKRANSYEVPWQVSFTDQGEHFCGGSIITDKCVLTAAHCFHSLRSNEYEIMAVVGSLDRRKAHKLGTSHKVVKKIFHPKWSKKTSQADIMVVCVSPGIHFRSSGHGDKSAIGPICLPQQNAVFTGNAKVSGFGKRTQSSEPSNRLYLLNQKLLSHSVCKRLYGKSDYPYDEKTMVCYGKGHGTGTCDGDSGGALVALRGHQWFQVGIVSYGDVCGESPTVFTRVAYYTDWIQRACNSCH